MMVSCCSPPSLSLVYTVSLSHRFGGLFDLGFWFDLGSEQRFDLGVLMMMIWGFDDDDLGFDLMIWGFDLGSEQGGGGGDVVAEQGGGGGDVVAEQGGGGGTGRWCGDVGQMNVLKRVKRSAEVRRLVDRSAWGRGLADVFGLQIFKKTNTLQEPYVCAPLRDADISAQKSFWTKNKQHLSDVFSVETPFFTPLASPAYVTPPLTPRGSSYRPFSPLSYSSSDAEFNRIRASPPPQFKFLKGVEDKREKRKPIERFGVDGPVRKSDENGSFITLIVSN
ncbi:hypothetical protein HanRHA438_Chr07g0319551 [Helianthus annuus]|nr:hypothetical protein HanRHA438_Chr07g0319551 [Helianthus annuus]